MQIFWFGVSGPCLADPVLPLKSWGTVVLVKSGDTLWELARRYNPECSPREGVEMIRQVNRLGRYIHPGQWLLIPGEAKPIRKKIPSRGQTERILACQATAYCYTGNHTATGTWPQEGRTIAVDPNKIPLHSRVQITCTTWPEINGTYIAEDTGGVVKGNIIDIYMDSYDQAIKWGRRDVQVMVLE